jgi:transketolase
VKKVNGHSYEELLEAFRGIRNRKSIQPLCIVAETVKGKGLDYVSNIPLMHGYMPKGEDVSKAYEELHKEL